MQNLAVTDSNFEDEVLKNKGLVLVDFWASWCYPCQMLGPVIEELGQELKEIVTVLKLDVDANPTTSGKYNVMSIPTVMLFKNGELVETFIGVQPKDVYALAIKKNSK